MNKIEYDESFKEFHEKWDKFEADRLNMNIQYVDLKRTYMNSCAPLEKRYGFRPSCKDAYDTAMSEFLARRNWPQCEIGSTPNIPLRKNWEEGYVTTAFKKGKRGLKATRMAIEGKIADIAHKVSEPFFGKTEEVAADSEEKEKTS